MGPASADDEPTPALSQDLPPETALSLDAPAPAEAESASVLLSDGEPLGESLGEDLGESLGEPAGSSAGPLAEGTGSSDLHPAASAALVTRPSFVFFGIVAGLSLAADISSKVWAEWTLNDRGFEPLELIRDHLSITLAYNRGGAWGLFASASDLVRKPFFLGVSIAAIAFIISLYARLTARQKALKWGLPLVLGGALGNLNDRITRSQVIDFIDFRADWIMDLNVLVHRYVPTWAMTDHWPTFNVADVAICVGVGLMAVDMFTHRPRRTASAAPRPPTSVDPTISGAAMVGSDTPPVVAPAVVAVDAPRAEAPPIVG